MLKHCWEKIQIAMGFNLSLLLRIDIVFSSGSLCNDVFTSVFHQWLCQTPVLNICEAFSAQGCGIQSTLILVETEDDLMRAHSLSSFCGIYFSFFPGKVQSSISNEICTININTVVNWKSTLILEEVLTSTKINEIQEFKSPQVLGIQSNVMNSKDLLFESKWQTVTREYSCLLYKKVSTSSIFYLQLVNL